VAAAFWPKKAIYGHRGRVRPRMATLAMHVMVGSCAPDMCGAMAQLSLFSHHCYPRGKGAATRHGAVVAWLLHGTSNTQPSLWEQVCTHSPFGYCYTRHGGQRTAWHGAGSIGGDMRTT
jgi:hypothetical protein